MKNKIKDIVLSILFVVITFIMVCLVTDGYCQAEYISEPVDEMVEAYDLKWEKKFGDTNLPFVSYEIGDVAFVAYYNPKTRIIYMVKWLAKSVDYEKDFLTNLIKKGAVKKGNGWVTGDYIWYVFTVGTFKVIECRDILENKKIEDEYNLISIHD